MLFYGPTLQHRHNREHEWCARHAKIGQTRHDTCFSLALKATFMGLRKFAWCWKSLSFGTVQVIRSRTVNKCIASHKVNPRVDLTLFEAACILFWRRAKHVRRWPHSSACACLNLLLVHTFTLANMTENVASCGRAHFRCSHFTPHTYTGV